MGDAAREDAAPEVALRVRLLGALRPWVPEGAVTLSAPQGAGLAEVRRRLAEALARRGGPAGGAELLARSALVDEARLLDVGWRVPATGPVALAALPPVHGG